LELNKNTLRVLKEIESKGERFYILKKNGEKELIKVWRISFDKGLFLHYLILQKMLKRILELGTSVGYSTLFLADAAKKVKGRVTTIEVMEEKAEMATSHLTKAGLTDYTTIINTNILDILPTYKEKIDFLFMDANKSQYIRYYQDLKDRLTSNGIIVADNIIKETTQPFVDKVRLDLGIELKEYEINFHEDYCLAKKI